MAHHTDSGKTYVDSSFVNDCQRIPGVSLTHMGMGEFYAETPKGRVDFDRMRGKDFPGQSGRSHELRGKGADWLVQQMERAGKSDRVASSGSFWVEQFKALDGVMPRYDASKVTGWNKVNKHYRASGLGPGAAAAAAHWYHEYKNGHATLEQAAASASKEIRPGQAERLIGRPVMASSHLRSGLIRLAAAQPQGSPERTALVAMLGKQAAWSGPKLTKGLAKQVAKRLDKHWPQTGVKSLQDIRDALGSGLVAEMSMSDRIDNQDAVKKWKASLSKDDLHKVFRWIEEIKNGKAKKTYRKTDEALAKLK
jgi:hypothetical protein